MGPIRDMLGDNFCSQFVGSPTKVLDSLRFLEALGISRVQVTEFLPGSINALADALG